MRAPALPVLVNIFILESNRYPIVLIAPELLHKFILPFLLPLSCQKCFDSFSALEELVSISPLGVCMQTNVDRGGINELTQFQAMRHDKPSLISKPAEYACATLAGSQVFHASSAALTFLVAVSRVNGGTGGLSGSDMLQNTGKECRADKRMLQRLRSARHKLDARKRYVIAAGDSVRVVKA